MKKKFARWVAGLVAVGLALGTEPAACPKQIQRPEITQNDTRESPADSAASRTDMRERRGESNDRRARRMPVVPVGPRSTQLAPPGPTVRRQRPIRPDRSSEPPPCSCPCHGGCLDIGSRAEPEPSYGGCSVCLPNHPRCGTRISSGRIVRVGKPFPARRTSFVRALRRGEERDDD